MGTMRSQLVPGLAFVVIKSFSASSCDTESASKAGRMDGDAAWGLLEQSEARNPDCGVPPTELQRGSGGERFWR
ncbi:hypothetical protein BDP81DRAFT_412949 [Colletotrichum phormii]|uniref:Uncharacterized protein n=1 Tax=Colletotrichum phormii TaxID=359342 RepID=A0AAJ0ELI3_9PEZI|nr:uncharacterized protein BDP81DRAFT_412949 [Colletotrichum phormii]KAK1655577.1 hypothetical protein BDP81DRAFT_412949 [Colletotrichum phormii]